MKELWIKYRTTIIGWLAALLGVSTVGWFTPDGQINLLPVLSGLALALFAYFVKDKQVTGGTVPATKEAEARTEGAAALPSTK